MRIESVTAHAFGPLVGPTLQFAPGMTVIVGDNESAKTSWHAAIYSALCGRPRRKGRPAADEQWFIDRHKPWDGEAWEVSARVRLDDGREIELRQDLAGNVACYAKDLQLARDVSNEIMEDGSPCAALWLGLDRRSFVATACIHQAQLLGVLKEAQGMQSVLQRAASTAGTDATAAEALGRLDAFQRNQVGKNDGRSVRPLRRAVVRLEEADAALTQARDAHENYLRAVEEVDRLRDAADHAQHELRLHEAAVSRKVADELTDRSVRAADLRTRLGDEPPPQASEADALANQVARALEAWTNRGEVTALVGPSSQEIRGELSALPETPDGDLAAHPSVQAEAEALIRTHQAFDAQAQSKPVVPQSDLPSVPQEEVLQLAHTLEVQEPAMAQAGPQVDELNREIARLDADSKRGRMLMVIGVIVVLGAAVAAATGPKIVGAAAVLGIALIIAGALSQKGRALRGARAQQSQLATQVAGAQEFAARVAADRSQAAARCTNLGLPASATELRSLAAEIARSQTFAEQTRQWEDQRRRLTDKIETARDTLRDALVARGVEVGGDLQGALDSYMTACADRAQAAAEAARRSELEAQLEQRVNAETMVATREQAMAAAGRQLLEAACACGAPDATPEESADILRQWEASRQDQLRDLDTRRSEWGELDPLLGGRTLDELAEAALAATADADARSHGFDDDQVRELAAGSPAAQLDALGSKARQAGEAAASAEGALREQAKDLTSVGEAEESQAVADEQLRWLKELDEVLGVTQEYLADAQERVQRDLAPELAATLTEWLPRITAGRYSSAIIDIGTLEVQVCGPERRWRKADRLSQGTSEQIYLLLRAALARHLTAGKDSCPLLLDDVTVQSDATRTVATLDLLHELAAEQQVIVFAQEDMVADWAREHLSASQDALLQLTVMSGT